jgi:hypothetical protein
MRTWLGNLSANLGIARPSTKWMEFDALQRVWSGGLRRGGKVIGLSCYLASMTLPPSKLPHVGTTIFTVMSKLAAEHGAINLGQGFPGFAMDARLSE